MTEVIFFDDGHGFLSPLTDTRASFDVRTGGLTTLDRQCAAFGLDPICLVVPAHLADVTRERHAAPRPGSEREKPPTVNQLPRTSEPRLFINGRCPLPLDSIASLEPGQALLEAGSGHLVAAVMEPAEFRAFQSEGKPPVSPVAEEPAPALLSRPWHVVTFRDRCLDIDLELLTNQPTQDLPPAVLGIGENPLTIAPTAVVYPGVTLDLEGGPIVISEHATIRPGATIIGPAFIGEHATILERALIRAHTAIGPWCKVSGEIAGVIMQAYSNKGHEGFLGDSWVGEWVNLGAGTTNSNLLNTYGEVIAKAPGAGNERTGLQFLGAIIGDHVKTAIGSRLMTGSIVQTGGMFAQSAAVSGTTPRFAWATDAGTKSFRHDKFVETAKAMMSRRKVQMSDAYLELLASLSASAAES